MPPYPLPSDQYLLNESKIPTHLEPILAVTIFGTEFRTTIRKESAFYVNLTTAFRFTAIEAKHCYVLSTGFAKWERPNRSTSNPPATSLYKFQIFND